MYEFLPGLKLCEYFYKEAVKPILDLEFPRLSYAAALLGSGSEVLGFDTPQSMDHHWGPKLMLFVSAADFAQYADLIKNSLSAKLPPHIHGIPTNWGPPDPIGIQHLVEIETGPVNHLVYIQTIDDFMKKLIGQPLHQLTLTQWLTIPEQKLLEVTSGKVFHDDSGELTKVRTELSYYPHDIWLYKLACQWMKISQEEAFIGRCGDVGDELGSQVVASRLVREIMRLAFLLERKYTPYSKWFGTAFSKLSIATTLAPLLRSVLLSPDWKGREGHLSQAYEVIAAAHNNLGAGIDKN